MRDNRYFNKIKIVILFIYGKKCLLCSHTSLSNHVHHVNSNCSDNSPYNLVVLCDNCHKMVHRLNIVLSCEPSEYQKKLLDQLIDF